ncbi:hypothetical protein A2Z00_03515 [Candidatus Gottesmanbacteria bacterium RBG_13_45_10]|uniref:Prepilin-type N-terminal cleavage/methylation domain-containing protein n=1 Tax=Candidatus Gottesmanbacteria bacterium RBG_13_45_10 TaxID=1798370 RepID=A0A1F5ZG60_9BACT|nr:MAG: hypothetical protein A2Z00_03515 [Candidatus Gottesmanbacteria bacterium RBG_13_45_10]
MDTIFGAHKKIAGFTLLETLITVGIIGMVGVLISQVFFTTTRTNTKTELVKDVKQNGDFALESMQRTIRNSLAIQTTCSPAPGTTSSSIDVQNPDGTMTTFGCAFDTSANATRIVATTSAGLQYLTSTNVSLGGTSCSDPNNTLAFVCTSYPDQPSSVDIQFRLSQKGTPVDQYAVTSISFETTVVPRN